MIRAILILALWLLGTAGSAWAFDVGQHEVLRYTVQWGFLTAGKADIEYTPGVEKNGLTPYVLEVRVQDSSILLDMQDSWRSEGHHSAARPFVPDRYVVVQHENSYRADKVMTFDAVKKQVTYQNRLHDYDKADPVPWEGMMRDAMSAVYSWRLKGAEALGQADRVEVMGVKRPFTLVKGAAKKEQIVLKGKSVEVWSVPFATEVDGKASRDSWVVQLRDDAVLTPVRIVARNKFGTFRAVLKE